MRVCVCARATACARNACGWGAPSTYFPATRAITLARIPSSIAAAPPARSLREAFASLFHVVTGHDPGTCGCHCAGDRAPRQRRRRAIDRADTAAAGSRRGRACGSPNAGSDTHKLQASRTDACDVPVFLVGKLSYPSV